MAALSSGMRLGPYEILSAIGAGGMGEVYRARDTRLDRTVAIKVLPSHFSADPERRQRFEREARAISSLSHPNICTLHDIGQQNGTDFLVMEYLEGQTLADRLEKGRFTTELVLRTGIQIADALDKAHRQGIIHRDLKPGNIMITKSGAKLLDFGLAKYQEPKASESSSSQLQTEGKPLTEEGTVLGTVQYMAPEQLEGVKVDERADIFALGSILYEMTTGQKAFTGKSKASLISAILTTEPSAITVLQPLSPAALDHVVRKCLEKEPDDRWQNAGDITSELKWILELGSQTHAAVSPRKKRQLLPSVLAILFFVSTAALSMLMWNRKAPANSPTFRFSVIPPEGYSFGAYALDSSNLTELALSPDGSRLAFVASDSSGKPMLCVRSLDNTVVTALSGTQGAQYPFWSPDGRFLGFFADRMLKKINLQQNSVENLCDAPLGRGGSWAADGTILFTPDVSGGIYRISSEGGSPSLVVEDGANEGNSYRWAQFLPDSRHFLYVSLFGSGQGSDMYLGSLDSKDSKLLVRDASNGTVVIPGYLAFVRHGKLLTETFDLRTFQVGSDAFQVVSDAIMYNNIRALAAFSISANGILSFEPDLARPSPLIWVDRSGKEIGRIGEPAYYENPSISPDGKRIALIRNQSHIEYGDVWLLDVDRNTMSRFNQQPYAYSSSPVWSPDGSQIFYGQNDLYRKSSNGTSLEELLLHDKFNKNPDDVSHDGKQLLFESDNKASKDLWLLPLTGKSQPSLLLKGAQNGWFSPDGKWLAYLSNESGQGEVYVRPFPELQKNKWQISNAAGISARWRRDGKEFYYFSPDRKLMAVDINTSSGFQAGLPKALFQLPQNIQSNDNVFDVSADGQRFILSSDPTAKYTSTVTVLTNWLHEAKP